MIQTLPTKPITIKEMVTDIYYVIQNVRPDLLVKYDVDEEKFVQLAITSDRLFFKLVQRSMFRIHKTITEDSDWEEFLGN